MWSHPTPDTHWEREKSTWPNHDLSSFVTAGGIRWHVQRTGHGPALLLLHGTGASAHSWRDLLPMLGLHFSVLAADLPGHGFTDAVNSAQRSIHGMSRCVAALLRALDVEPSYGVGHSAGAVILCRMALDGLARPRGIVSINGAFLPLQGAASVLFSPLAKMLAGNSLLPRLLARHADSRASVVRMLGGTGSRLDEVGIELYRRLARNPRHVAGALGMMGSWDLRSFVADLPRLDIPLTLLVAGNDKTVPPEQATRIARLVPRARVIALPNLGHLAHEEAPSLLAQTILSLCPPSMSAS